MPNLHLIGKGPEKIRDDIPSAHILTQSDYRQSQTKILMPILIIVCFYVFKLTKLISLLFHLIKILK